MMSSLECHKCGRWVENIGDGAVKVTCSICVLQAVGFPKEKKSYRPTGRPAGWHWMAEFVDKDGNVFHRGKEQPKLKGTLPPTKGGCSSNRATATAAADQSICAVLSALGKTT